MNRLGSLLLLLPVLCLGQTPPTPKWHSQFSVNFNESTKILWRRQTTGKWWYDAVAQVEVVERDDGNGDRYCGSIHAFSHTPCKHVVTEGKRHLIFPDLGECCMCCTAEQGCGLLSPTWLDTAEYQGTVEMNGVQTYKWSAPGLQDNFYYSTADKHQLPVELDQMPNDLQTFQTESFKPEPTPPTVYEIPSDCHSRCPISSICTFFHADNRATTATS